jgi:hypothetical protein
MRALLRLPEAWLRRLVLHQQQTQAEALRLESILLLLLPLQSLHYKLRDLRSGALLHTYLVQLLRRPKIPAACRNPQLQGPMDFIARLKLPRLPVDRGHPLLAQRHV